MRQFGLLLVAIALGALIGHFWPATGEALKPLGDAFIKLVKMIIAPVIFLTVVTGIAGMRDIGKVGGVAAKAFAYFIAVSSFALVVGLIVANVLQPGAGMNIDPATLDAEAVKGYATHEREVLDEVTARRADATKATTVEGTAAADAQMTGLLGRLMVVAEAYPDLKANSNFLDLQQQLSNIEAELQSARRYYNATVRNLNTSVQSFPPVLIAKPLGFSEEPFYQDEDPAIQSAPKVSFDPAA